MTNELSWNKFSSYFPSLTPYLPGSYAMWYIIHNVMDILCITLLTMQKTFKSRVHSPLPFALAIDHMDFPLKFHSHPQNHLHSLLVTCVLPRCCSIDYPAWQKPWYFLWLTVISIFLSSSHTNFRFRSMNCFFLSSEKNPCFFSLWQLTLCWCCDCEHKEIFHDPLTEFLLHSNFLTFWNKSIFVFFSSLNFCWTGDWLW